MILMPNLRRIRAGRPRLSEKQMNDTVGDQTAETELKSPPANFLCPISLDLMNDPVILSSGITYDRSSIERWFEAGNRTCPVTNQILKTRYPIPNQTLRRMIQDWCEENQRFGVERIPTPKPPLGPNEVLEILQHGEHSAKQTAVIELGRLLSFDGPQNLLDRLREEVQGFHMIILDLVKRPLSPAVAKSALTVILLAFADDETMGTKFAGIGFLGTLLQIMVDHAPDRSICERALEIFDMLCEYEEGREEAWRNALTIPVLVKKLLRVSSAATVFSVSALWKLCKHGDEEVSAGVMVEAAQVGAFQKLLLLLQIGCDDATKEKATDILKKLNSYTEDGLECIDSADFKNLRRPF
ncbi:hypothetical protein Nepgr_017945 [Nepenthes gracilis]|uniref:U-box domain-containing protein n=1 Tax=Nepenthes gracilis TaxID=150966 RepID=A0AAD3SSL2_NEPGR|nr:hypothetical protein Nepgr_017945 [Nepenthes gracilis]